MSAVISLDDVSFSYGGPMVLEHITLAVEDGTFIGLVGPNGGGKSTLLKVILGLLEPQSGRVSVLGRRPRAARKALGYVPQFAAFSRGFPISVEQTVLMGRLGITSLLGGYRRRDKEAARSVMEETEVLDIAHRPIGTLSGGQLQRVLIARALATDPKILILDEPTANIDLRAEKDIFDLLAELNRRMSILVVSHDIGFISTYVSQVACLNQTLICHHTTGISGAEIERLYGSPVNMIQHLTDHHHHGHGA